ncbi:sensor histidine kinase [Aurantimonas endophytica]|uniref:histidine kinase n=1 Tax=Aurantimonas endophytica TaxID=1522175 RepID=A0A7W6MQN8_9HYPH|nr:HAMP domain-containing sensor histidine kinase [Aurantimonas endophytica]MBB4004230.1 signal transduction histidine kinase [Aurantimonas endophytica]MCO6405071.1 HAMP domain-containing protein [Aurantimonas endophytica]
MERLKALMRMTAVRLSAVYLLLFAVCAVVLVFYVTATASNILKSQSRAAIAEEISELGLIYETAGIIGLVRTIDRRARQPGASLYLATDATGRIIAGNVESLQAGVLDKGGFTENVFGYERFADNADDRYHIAVAEVVSLPNGMRILVGRDQTEQERFRQVVRSALILALALMGAAALLAWVFVGRRALQRLDRMSAASNRILAGDLTERLPVTGAGDEFDRLSENLNRLLARVALLQEGLRQVSDNIAHDLKTPLTRLRNRAEAALGGGTGEGVPREALEGMIGEADQMIRTFDALLMISRVEAGSHPVLKDRVDIATIVADVCELYEPLAEEVGARLVVDAPSPVPALVSRELIAQALSNLIDNALKYAVGKGRQTTVTIRLSAQDGNCILSVADDGPGIPADQHERVLERFYRLDQSRTMPGSGLGLSLVQAIARVHDGELTLEDAAPGLRVVLVFPLDGRTGSDDGG